ncbi:Methionine synthase [Neomoorella glycerini]|uniref:Methionine synthase n=1 Tax=Neomoorella glycerini TaxID=55779 RepID=A0A6I5ZMM2_9FIRM|nr:corrinoid protein [Moorella glycerini]QGP91132.1 Methionine synthase [Moorella glycerini]
MTALAEALRDLNEKKVYELVDKMLEQGASPEKIISECNEGMVAVGDLFASNQYFLTELMFSAEIMKEVMQKLEPLMESSGVAERSAGTVVIGTVKNDIHDIGKNIVVSLLRSHGFKVVDLGVDVPAEKFVEAVRETGAKVLGLSALLNSTYPEMKNVVEAITEAGLREQVKIIIGGTICNETVRKFTGADFYANDAVTGVKICKSVYS